MRELLPRLNEVGPYAWVECDGERWGDYVATTVLAPSWARIVEWEDGPGYLLDVHFKSDSPDAEAELRALEKTLLDHVLPGIGARRVRAADTAE